LLGRLSSALLALRLRLKRPSVIIIAHGDVDGVLSAVIAARSIGDNPEFLFSGPRSIHRTLSLIPPGPGRLILVDIGVNANRLNELEAQLARLKRSGWSITWIDHHQWPENAVERLSRHADSVIVRPSPSAARVVLEELSGDGYSEELVKIADDADTATYRTEFARMFRPLTRNHKRRMYLLRALLEGCLEDENIRKWGTESVDKERMAVEKALKVAQVRTTASGRKYALIDLRPRGGPGSAVAKKMAAEHEVSFSLVLYSCERFSLYAGAEKDINLRPVCEEQDGGGHPYACGGRIRLPAHKKLLCCLLGRRYTPKEILDLIKKVEERY